MKLRNNIILFYAISFLQACIFYIPIRYFFFVNYHNFWIWDAILIETFSGLTLYYIADIEYFLYKLLFIFISKKNLPFGKFFNFFLNSS